MAAVHVDRMKVVLDTEADGQARATAVDSYFLPGPVEERMEPIQLLGAPLGGRSGRQEAPLFLQRKQLNAGATSLVLVGLCPIVCTAGQLYGLWCSDSEILFREPPA